MTLKDKYTYLALMALAMFGIGFWMLSIGGGASNPPSIPDPLAQTGSVADQFKGSLNLGNKAMEDKLKQVLLIPDTFNQFGTTKCEKGEEIVRNFLKSGQTSYFLSHEKELSARDYLRRIDPVNFYHLVLHFNAKENKWASLGTNVGNIAITGDKLDSYKIPAGEPVLVILIGFQENEDKDTYFDPATGETKKLVFVKHCQNSFPDNVSKLHKGWNLIVSDLVQVADDPHALSVSALDVNSVVASMDLNMIQTLSSQLEGVLSWVNYDPNRTREGYNPDNNVPRLGFDLQSDSEVVLSFSKTAQEIASFKVVPQNSPNIKAVALRATNVDGFEFSDLFTQIYFKVNDKRLKVSDLESDTLIAYFDDLNSDDLFDDGPMKISVFAKTHSENSVENLQLGMAFDLGESQSGEPQIAKTLLPPLFVEFESIVADTYFEVLDDDSKIDDLSMNGDDIKARLVFKLLNNTRNSVDVNSIFLPFKNSNGLSEVTVTPGKKNLDIEVKDFEGQDTVLLTSKGIYLYPNSEITLASKQPSIIPVYLKFNKDFNGSIEFKKIQIDTNEIDLDFDERVLKLTYTNEGATTLPSQMTAAQNEQFNREQQQGASDSESNSSRSESSSNQEDSDSREDNQVAVSDENQNALGGLFGSSNTDDSSGADDSSNTDDSSSDSNTVTSSSSDLDESSSEENSEQNETNVAPRLMTEEEEQEFNRQQEGVDDADDLSQPPTLPEQDDSFPMPTAMTEEQEARFAAEQQLSTNFAVTDQQDIVRLDSDEAKELVEISFDEIDAFRGVNLVDFYDSYSEVIRLQIKTIDNQSIDWYLEDDNLSIEQRYTEYYNILKDAVRSNRAPVEIWAYKINNQAQSFDNLSFELITIYDDSYSVELPRIFVLQEVDSMKSFVQLENEFNVSASEQAQEFDLMEFDFTFYDEDVNWLQVYPVRLSTEDYQGVRFEIRYTDTDEVLGSNPDPDNLQYEVKLVSVFEPGYFIDMPSLDMQIEFLGSSEEINQFEFKFIKPELLNVYQNSRTNQNSEFVKVDGKLKTNNFLEFNYDFSQNQAA